MAHPVKCAICGQTFDRDRTDCVPYKKRYAHTVCQQRLERGEIIEYQKEKEDKEKIDRLKVTDYVQAILGDENVNWSNVGRQITAYLKKGWTIDGIYNALYYWYDIKGNSTEKANGGITIVDYIYEDAQKYFKELDRIKEVNKDKSIQERQEEQIVIKYKVPNRKIKCYLGEEEEDLEF